MLLFFFFKQKTAYEMRISDWSSDVCSSDLTRFDDIPRNAILDNCIDTFIHKTSRYLCAMSNHYAIGRSTGDEREGISWFGLAGRGVRSRRSNRLQLGNWLNGNAINGTEDRTSTRLNSSH